MSTDRILRNSTSDIQIPTNMTLDGLASLIKQLHYDQDKKITSLNKVFEQKFDKFMDSINKKHAILSKEMTSKISDVENKVETKIQQIKLEYDAKIKELQNESERQNIKCDIVIHGVPVINNENIMNVIHSLLDKLEISHSAVSLAFRLKVLHKGRHPQPILLKCSSVSSKSSIISKYFAYKTLNLSCIGFESTARIYINECLTKSDRIIKEKLLKLQKEGKIYKVSIRNGQVMVKLTAEDSSFKIFCESDLS